MPRKTQKEILASPEWEWWQESINCIPDWDKRVYAKKRILGSLVSCNDSGGILARTSRNMERKMVT